MKYLETNNLEDLVKEGVTLVDFYAEWCGPCKMLHPVLESIENKVNIIKVDIDKFQDIAMKNRIMSVPTLVFYKDGKKAKEVIGFRSKEDLLEIINNL